MSRITILLIGLLLVILIGAAIFFTRPKTQEGQSQSIVVNSTKSSPTAPAPASAPATQPAKLPAGVQATLAEKQKAYVDAFDSPVDFWGKVIDDKGNPVAAATAMCTLNDKPNAYEDNGGTKLNLTSDEQGLFSLTGKHGASLAVTIKKTATSTTQAMILRASSLL